MPKTILSTKYSVAIPEGVTVGVKARVVTVKGPRGELTKSFKHRAIDITDQGDKLRVDSWYGTKKDIACVRTIASHIDNMIIGVTQVRVCVCVIVCVWMDGSGL